MPEFFFVLTERVKLLELAAVRSIWISMTMPSQNVLKSSTTNAYDVSNQDRMMCTLQ